jgi:hypothetical protein
MAASLNRFSNGIACRDSCTNDQPCFPIAMEPFASLSRNSHCMEFVRSAAVCGSGETSLLTASVHQREQVNQVRVWSDNFASPAKNILSVSDKNRHLAF